MKEENDSMGDTEPEDISENQNTIPQPQHQASQKRRHSYVWNYFTQVPEHLEVFRCKVCSETFGNKTANLGRHLQTVHGISDIHRENSVRKGRPNRSFVWNFCTKLDEKRALCHLCKKVLYFGGGNTSNITKHLRRMHAEKIEEASKHIPGIGRSDADWIKRDRKSYIWNYCEKLSENSVMCNLCNRRMRFHGTANVITHLQRRHGIMGEDTVVKVEEGGSVQEAATSSTNEQITRSSRSSSNGCFAWRFMTRVSDETVRCLICLKDLSFQGTSNLQRHLHRMHNVVWNGSSSDESAATKLEQDSEITLLAFCEATNDATVWKCQMCDAHFEHNDNMEETVVKHMVRVHGAALRSEMDDYAPENEDETIHALYTNVLKEDTSAVNEHDGVQIEVANVEADEELYHAIIEEEDMHEIVEISDQVIEEDTYVDSASGYSVYPVDYESNESTDAQLVTTTIQADDTPAIRMLKEDLLRQQASYFSEKAAYYRMQKYLIAQQVRKERLQIEKLKSTHAVDNNIVS
ncbi:uncharacterized protein LOC108602989 isoform X2 [Drosophila busckii]|uniref:uncharacterized protein LOC108602989 isoform X2 n=1 Tax=Drosophila busckii TaxID=30019 RepID=UPI00083F0604|nr:uncharacterized protein LOC108602989 isoform X2 [Drosophila busckii]